MENLKNEINVNNLFDLYDAIIGECENNNIRFTAQYVDAYANAFNIWVDDKEIELMEKVHKEWKECENKCSDSFYHIVKAPLIGEA